MLNIIPMKKGIIHLIPVVIVAAVFSLGLIGVVGTQRSQGIETGNVLSSSNQNKGQEKSPEKGKNQNQNIPNQTNETKSQKSEGKSEITGKTKQSPETNALETEVENEATEEASPSATPGRKIRTNFPITVNPLTNEKIVTTPSGIHIVILPEVAIQNMIKAGFPVILPPEPSPSPSSSPEATPSATPSATPEASLASEVEDGSIVLTELNNELVYEIPAIKNQKFLGLFSIKVKIKGYVSAESGNILEIKKSFFDNILDFLSF